MNTVSDFFHSHRSVLESIHTSMKTLESDLFKFENTRTPGLFGEQITASFSKRIITKVSRSISRVLRFKLEKEQIEYLLTDALLNLNQCACAALRFHSKLLFEKASALYKKVLELLPGTAPLQLTLFGSEEYKVLVDKPKRVRKVKKEVLSTYTQLELF